MIVISDSLLLLKVKMLTIQTRCLSSIPDAAIGGHVRDLRIISNGARRLFRGLCLNFYRGSMSLPAERLTGDLGLSKVILLSVLCFHNLTEGLVRE